MSFISIFCDIVAPYRIRYRHPLMLATAQLRNCNLDGTILSSIRDFSYKKCDPIVVRELVVPDRKPYLDKSGP